MTLCVMAATAENLETLQSMFPDRDEESFRSVLAATGSVEAAIQQLLDGPKGVIDADEVRHHREHRHACISM